MKIKIQSEFDLPETEGHYPANHPQALKENLAGLFQDALCKALGQHLEHFAEPGFNPDKAEVLSWDRAHIAVWKAFLANLQISHTE